MLGLTISCVSKKSYRSITKATKMEILNYESVLLDSIAILASTGEAPLPPFERWQADRNSFIAMIKDYERKNELIRRKAGKTNTGFVISGSVIGLGGGIYGLVSENEPKGAAVTSLISGALTALVASLNLQRKSERAYQCSEFLQSILLDYEAYWGDIRYPSSQEDLIEYLKSKDDIINRLKEMKCFGLPAGAAS